MNILRSVLVAAAVLAAACASARPQEFHVIPMPEHVTLTDGVFRVKGAPVRTDEAMDAASVEAVGRFARSLETATGKKARKGKGGFRFQVNPALGAEEYTIHIDRKEAVVEASGLNGFVYACETLRQMLPAPVYGVQKEKADWVLPCVDISDAPRFGYRGVMLDACRHFWSVEETKRIIDVMAAYKMNRLHWHLSDDQGWRVEIKDFPKLTEIGAWRDGTMVAKDFASSDGIRYGGFYTQEELREVVAYAAARGITIIPEIDLPGHMVAALAAYPELGCTGGPYKVRQIWGISQDILCAGNEDIYAFIEGVMAELTGIFPSEYIHIGGDECFGSRKEREGLVPWDKCPKCTALMEKLGIQPGKEARHYLQNYVTARVQAILAGKGRRIIGWDEILQGELAPGATVMSWRGTKGGINAVGKGMDVVMSPNSFMYIDHYQSKQTGLEPLAIGGYLPVETVYGYEPLEGMPEGAESHILGVQCNLWTEYIATPEHLEYMLLPRMCATAEVGWCAATAKDFDRFSASLEHTTHILDALGLNYSLSFKGLYGLDRKPAPQEQAEN